MDTESTILTGSSDGLVRAVQILPTKLLGIVADHGEWPIERIAIGGGHRQMTLQPDGMGEDRHDSSRVGSHSTEADVAHPQRRWWVGSVGHDEVLRMTDLEGFFRDNESEETTRGTLGLDVVDDDSDVEDRETLGQEGEQDAEPDMQTKIEDENDEDDSGDDEDEGIPQPRKRKRKPEAEHVVSTKKKKGKNNASTVEVSFFDGL